MEKFLNRLANLLSIKSFIALIVAGIFAYQAVSGGVSGEDIKTVFTLILGFYFGAPQQKAQSGGGGNE